MEYSCLKQKNGFTLVEVMVVVVIISLLSTVIFFAVDKARAAGRDTARIAAISQLQIALKLYYEKHSSYPSATSDPSYPDCTGGADGDSFSATGCMNVLVKEKLIPSLPVKYDNPLYASRPFFEYDGWCRVSKPGDTSGSNTDKQYRLWVYGEKNNGGVAKNWWYDEVIGATTCVDPS